MLVLTRKANQQIVIGGRITVTVLKIEGNRVCVGIEAPQDISVNRAEIVFDVAGTDRAGNGDSATRPSRKILAAGLPN